ncbi:LemA family protein [bacterium]|nr:LemA family protein [bacterium]
MDKKNNGVIALLIILGILLLGMFWFIGVRNGLVTEKEALKSAWAQVENQYQRRSDLIPNLVNTVQGYADQEEETLLQVTQARSLATSMNINFEGEVSAEELAAYDSAQGFLSNSLSRLLAISESYPNLKANESFLELQSQLEGTENRIATERGRFNEKVREFNTSIKLFPKNFIANALGYTEYPYFESDEGSEEVPNVEF